MIFLRYESFRGYIRSYPVTVTIAALNILLFLINLLTNNVLMNKMVFYTVPGVDSFGLGEPWRYITSIFMHANFEHLLFNMISLIIFAPPLEYVVKSWRYSIFYLLCGIGGNLISGFITFINGQDYHLAVGASGAIYGVYGAYLFIAIYHKRMIDEQSKRTIYIILGLGIVSSLFIAKIDFWGHVGGLITGFLLYRLIDQLPSKYR